MAFVKNFRTTTTKFGLTLTAIEIPELRIHKLAYISAHLYRGGGEGRRYLKFIGENFTQSMRKQIGKIFNQITRNQKIPSALS